MTSSWPPSSMESISRAVDLLNAGKRRPAARLLKEVLKADPNHPDALEALAVIHGLEHEYAEAGRLLERVLQQRPDDVPTLLNLGTAHMMLQRPAEAESVLSRAARLVPGDRRAHELLGQSRQSQGKLAEAADSFIRAVELAPGDVQLLARAIAMKQKACLWNGLPTLERALLDTVRTATSQRQAVEPFVLLHVCDDPALQRRNAELYWRALMEDSGLGRPKRRSHRPRQRQRIRLGYVSADFHEHAVAHLIAQLIELHDRTRFEVIAFACGPDDHSPMRQRLKNAFDRFMDVRSLSDEQLADRIAASEIDIAIDLTGHTGNARLAVFARRPAPVQCHFLGYPGTIGGDALDYIIVDPVIAPPGAEAHYTERLVRLPDSYQPNDTRRELAAGTPDRQSFGLPEKAIVLCSFNGQQKLTPVMLDVWARILAAVPETVLWLYCDVPLAADNLRREVANRGIASERIVTAGKLPAAQHLARLQLADLFLDALPYGAHTTASDALWIGLPVLTSMGQAFPGRVCAGLLSAVGLPELITPDLASYEAKAIELARAPHQLVALRERLAAARLQSALFDADRFRRNIEEAYAAMWDRWVRGAPPDHITVGQ